MNSWSLVLPIAGRRSRFSNRVGWIAEETHPVSSPGGLEDLCATHTPAKSYNNTTGTGWTCAYMLRIRRSRRAGQTRLPEENQRHSWRDLESPPAGGVARLRFLRVESPSINITANFDAPSTRRFLGERYAGL